jgi:hypothetical protein
MHTWTRSFTLAARASRWVGRTHTNRLRSLNIKPARPTPNIATVVGSGTGVITTPPGLSNTLSSPLLSSNVGSPLTVERSSRSGPTRDGTRGLAEMSRPLCFVGCRPNQCRTAAKRPPRVGKTHPFGAIDSTAKGFRIRLASTSDLAIDLRCGRPSVLRMSAVMNVSWVRIETRRSPWRYDPVRPRCRSLLW